MNGITRLLVLAFGAYVLSGCGGLGFGTIGQSPKVRVFNAVDNQSPITVTYKDSSGNSLATSQAATFAGVPAQDVLIKNTNATPSVQVGAATLFTGTSKLYQVNSRYSLYAGGVPGNYVAIPLNDDVQKGTTATSLDVRAVHVGANTPAADVYIALASPGGVSGTALFTGLTFGHVSAAGNSTVVLDANGYGLLAATSNTIYQVIVTAHNSKVPIATTTSILNPTVYYTVVVYDSGNGTGVQILSDRH